MPDKISRDIRHGNNAGDCAGLIIGRLDGGFTETPEVKFPGLVAVNMNLGARQQVLELVR